MAIKAGQILTYGNTFLIERIQNYRLGIDKAKEQINEFGNYAIVGEDFGTPEITFDIETFDLTPRLEFLLGRVFHPKGTYTSYNAVPVNTSIKFSEFASKTSVISPIKTGEGSEEYGFSAVIPGLELTELSYSVGGGDRATKTATVNGSQLLYVFGVAAEKSFIGNGSTKNFSIPVTNPIQFTSSGVTSYTIYVEVDNIRKYEDIDFNTSYSGGNITIAFDSPPASGAIIVALYAYEGTEEFDPQDHSDTSVIPAGIKSQYVDVKLRTAGTGNYVKIGSLTNFELTGTLSTEAKDFLGFSEKRIDKGAPEITATLRFSPASIDNFKSFLTTYIFDSSSALYVAAEDLTDLFDAQIDIRSPLTNAVICQFEIFNMRPSIPGIDLAVDATLESDIEYSATDFEITKTESVVS